SPTLVHERLLHPHVVSRSSHYGQSGPSVGNGPQVRSAVDVISRPLGRARGRLQGDALRGPRKTRKKRKVFEAGGWSGGFRPMFDAESARHAWVETHVTVVRQTPWRVLLGFRL